MDPQALRWRDACNRLLDFVSEGQDIAGIARIPCGYAVGTEKARGRVCRDPRLAPKLHGASALAFEDGRDGEIVGIDELTVPEFLAAGEPGGWRADVGMGAQRRAERRGGTLALRIAQRRLGQEVLRLPPQGDHGLATP